MSQQGSGGVMSSPEARQPLISCHCITFSQSCFLLRYNNTNNISVGIDKPTKRVDFMPLSAEYLYTITLKKLTKTH